MATQKPAATPAGWSVQFRDLLSRAEQARVPLAVVGSVALAIRGIDVCPGDIDVITTLEGADALAESYQDALVVPLFTRPGFGEIRPGLRRRDPRRVARQPNQGAGRPVAARCRRMVDRQPLRGSPLGKPAPARAAAGATASRGGPAPATGSSRRYRRVPRNPRKCHLKQGHWAYRAPGRRRRRCWVECRGIRALRLGWRRRDAERQDGDVVVQAMAQTLEQGGDGVDGGGGGGGRKVGDECLQSLVTVAVASAAGACLGEPVGVQQKGVAGAQPDRGGGERRVVDDAEERAAVDRLVAGGAVRA